PFGELDFEEAIDIFKEQVKALILAGADLFVIETMIDIQEARAALIAVKELCDKFTIVTMTYELTGRTLNGTTPLSALITLQSLGADAVGANCSTGPKEMLKFIKAMKPFACVPIAAKPNAGLPKLINGKAVFDMSSEDFALASKKFVSCGTNFFGGCCGTTPEYIAEVKKTILNKKPALPIRKSISALSSPREGLILEKRRGVLIVGEGINPTGKKMLQLELKEKKMTLVRRLAKEQEEAGADLLDVNVGVPSIDEENTMLRAISVLAHATNLSLCIDSSDVKVVEKALRFYPGRALINSISAEKGKMDKLLSLAGKYGAMFIALPVSGKVIPATFGAKIKIIKNILKSAQAKGLTKADMIVDALIMTISCNKNAAKDALSAISWCSKVLKCNTIIGLSNISFGLPQRKIINQAFLNLAKVEGLNLAIANPLRKGSNINKMAKDLLLNKPRALEKFIEHYSKHPVLQKKNETIKPTLTEEISKAIIEGNREDIVGLTSKIIKEGKDPLRIMQEVMIPAIVTVGKLFDKKEYFLPQLISSAEAMKNGTAVLLPYIKNKSAKDKNAIVMLATVRGDIHDIGKNIVSLLLSNHGFKIVDLGKDVSTESIIKAIKTYKPDIVGLSALMTTTMVNMKKVIEAAKAEKLNCKFMIGGAVVTEGYAKSIEAAYAKDGVQAVSVAKKLAAK
ncbi:MAG: homocysteine S-methyltransferase family protein, partial [Candidatus Omnitrophota bacterium]